MITYALPVCHRLIALTIHDIRILAVSVVAFGILCGQATPHPQIRPNPRKHLCQDSYFVDDIRRRKLCRIRRQNHFPEVPYKGL